MKKILMTVILVCVMFPSYHIHVATENIGYNDEELKEYIQEVVEIKDIEWEIIFGYPLELARENKLFPEGRSIDNVIAYLDKYYEEEVVDKYIYYLKRSTSQKLYKHTGVFWGSDYAVVGNVYKRDAESVSYEIEYICVDEQSDGVIEVEVNVTTIFNGDYNIRGVEKQEYREDPITYIFKVRKNDSDKYKLVDLSVHSLSLMES